MNQVLITLISDKIEISKSVDGITLVADWQDARLAFTIMANGACVVAMLNPDGTEVSKSVLSLQDLLERINAGPVTTLKTNIGCK